MGRVLDKETLIRNIVRLRRAARAAANDEEIDAVRADLERAVGPTVSRAVAARVLRISQTALDRWIDKGDIPAVITPTGRREVPLHALADLVEALDERERETDERHPLASVLRPRRAGAERLDVGKMLPRRDRLDDGEHGHRGAELRSLAYHRAVAQRLDEQVVSEAQRRLRRWRAEGRIDPRYAARWEQILSLPLPRIARAIGEDNPEARDLRQSSPFAGTLNERERRRVLNAVGEILG